VVHRMHIFPEASAPANTVYTGAYFKTAGRKRFVLTDHLHPLPDHQRRLEQRQATAIRGAQALRPQLLQ